MNPKILAASALACAMSWTQLSTAAIVRVPQDRPTIQLAIDDVVHGDTVLVSPGLYKERIDFLGKAITVCSSDGAHDTVIDGEQGGHTVTCNSGEAENTILKGFTITGGLTPDLGGGMFNDGTSPTIIDCVFIGNVGSDGGGMENWHGGHPLVIGCRFIRNIATDKGGGMWTGEGAAVTVIDCDFIGNVAQNVTGGDGAGGGFWAGDGPLVEIRGCTFMENKGSSAFPGAAVFIKSGQTALIVDSVLCQNWPDEIAGEYEDGGGNESSCKGDIDVDDNRGFGDILEILSNWGPCP